MKGKEADPVHSHAALFPIVRGKLAAAQKLQSTSLEYTLVSNGFFLDYYGLPKVESYLQPFVFAIDMANDAAAIPGSGVTPVVFTHTFDVARFVVALVDQASWPKRSIIVGDKKTWNEVLSIAEEVKGLSPFAISRNLVLILTVVDIGTKFNVAYDNEARLGSFQVTELPSHPSFYPFLPKEQLQYILAVFGRWTSEGEFNLPENDTLNIRFPEIKTRTVREVLEQGWRA